MTAIAGLIHFDGKPLERAALERMRNVLISYGQDAQNIWQSPNAGLVRNLRRISPEDSFDRQPLVDREGRFFLVFDGRIDNRNELAGKLEISSREAGLMADSAFVLAAFEKWGDECVQHLLGDFAFACWDRKDRRLVMARDPLGHRPLYWYRESDWFAFATLPKGLMALPGVPRELCEERIASLLALLPMKGPESYFRDIFRVEPGHLTICADAGVSSKGYHSFDPSRRVHLKDDDAYVEMACELFDKAVACRLRSVGKVASHLSSGFDSSSVTAVAARLLGSQGRNLIAYTAVPREGFSGPVPKGRHADEGPAAAALAERHANLEHVLIRPEDRTAVGLLGEVVQVLDRAPLNPCNGVWIDGIQADAMNRGVRVLLTGQMGNMSISYDGRPRLPSLLRRGQLVSWFLEACALVRETKLRPRGALIQSVGPFLPAAVWRLLNLWRGNGIQSLFDYSAINPELVETLGLYERSRELGWDMSYRPRWDGWKMRTAVINRVDSGEYFAGTVGGYGLEMRDPTADLCLLEFCLAIPEEQYLKAGRTRWLLRRMMQDQLPPEILSLESRGLQAADWYEGSALGRDEMRRWLERLEKSANAPRYLDLKRMRRALDDWPEGGWADLSTIQTYRLMLLRGLSVGAFIDYVEGGNC